MFSTVVFKDVKKVVFYVFINKKKLLSNIKWVYLVDFFNRNNMFLSPLVQINVSSTSRGNPLEFESVLIWKINVDKVAVFEKSQFSWNQSGFKIRSSQFLWNQSGFKLTFDRSWFFSCVLVSSAKNSCFLAQIHHMLGFKWVLQFSLNFVGT